MQPHHVVILNSKKIAKIIYLEHPYIRVLVCHGYGIMYKCIELSSTVLLLHPIKNS